MFLFILLYSLFLHADLEDHFKKPLGKQGNHAMRNIDFIYMINLDQRPEKWKMSVDQLSPYNIHPYRFSAVNGWELTLETINDVGMQLQDWMKMEQWGTYYEGDFEPKHEPIYKLGRTYFCHCMSRGAIGIALSHLSVLYDAFISGYETIWVMEDDIEVIRDPRVLSSLIEQLDASDPEWDLLFTDQDIRSQKCEYIPAYSGAKRPDYESPNYFAEKKQVGIHFRKIGSRYGAHSMIIRRKGIQKLLQFFQSHKIFSPYDLDYALPAFIRLYILNEDVVSNLCKAISDNGGPRYLDPKD